MATCLNNTGRYDAIDAFWGNDVQWSPNDFIPAWALDELPLPGASNNSICLPTTPQYLQLFINNDNVVNRAKVYTLNLERSLLGFSRETYVLQESWDLNPGNPGDGLILTNTTLLTEANTTALPQLLTNGPFKTALIVILDANGPATQWGTNGNDSFVGTAFKEVYFARQGADSVSGNSGDDVLRGQAGDDWLSGQQGNDTLLGDEGADSLFGGQGDDAIYGGSGDDQLTGALGIDIMDGMEGNDLLRGGAALDVLIGGFGNDTLFAGAGVSTGSAFFDSSENWLLGEGGDDFLYGGVDADLLDGGRGLDEMTGGAGADTFVLGEGGVDRVQDFNAATGDRVRAARVLGAIATTQFSYNSITGALFFDASATDSFAPIQIATLVGAPTFNPATHLSLF